MHVKRDDALVILKDGCGTVALHITAFRLRAVWQDALQDTLMMLPPRAIPHVATCQLFNMSGRVMVRVSR